MTDPQHNAFEQPVTMSGKPSGFRALVGYKAVVWRRDYAEVELEIDDRHMNSLGILHGGVYMTMMDAAMGHAAPPAQAAEPAMQGMDHSQMGHSSPASTPAAPKAQTQPMQGMDRNNQTVTSQDLDRMLKNLESMARSGDNS